RLERLEDAGDGGPARRHAVVAVGADDERGAVALDHGDDVLVGVDVAVALLARAGGEAGGGEGRERLHAALADPGQLVAPEHDARSGALRVANGLLLQVRTRVARPPQDLTRGGRRR